MIFVFKDEQKSLIVNTGEDKVVIVNGTYTSEQVKHILELAGLKTEEPK